MRHNATEKGISSLAYLPSIILIRATLNVCIPYASRDEIAYAVNRCVQKKRLSNGHATPRRENGHQTNGLHIHNGFSCDSSSEEEHFDAITVQDIDSKMMLAHSPPLDILVRTSGVCRLSDFMLWQVGIQKDIQRRHNY